MSIYAVGDVQGCYRELRALLALVGFDRKKDSLWFTGDLVNRGPQSLEVLRFVASLGDSAIAVLGNHDLHLLAAAHGHRKLDKNDTLGPILEAPDREALLHWLRHRPLFHYDAALRIAILHAGLPPQWDLRLAEQLASETEGALRGDDLDGFLKNMSGDTPERWSAELAGYERLRFSVNCFTRMRYCGRDGRLDLKSKGPPGSQPQGLLPWFEVPNRRSRDFAIVFGHWSTLQLSGPPGAAGVYPLDTGCVWGGKLTALRLEDETYYGVNAFGKPAAGE